MEPTTPTTNGEQAIPRKPEPAKVAEHWAVANAADNNHTLAVIEAWKQTVSVQMHFNDICLKLRNLAITMLAAAIGLAAYTTKENFDILLFGLAIPIGTIVALAGLIGWIAFYSMDRHWYHIFLRASGVHAGRIEERWRKQFPELMLSSQIAEDSKRVWFGMNCDSRRRLDLFYFIGAIVMLVTAIAVSFVRPRVAPATPTAATITTPSAQPQTQISVTTSPVISTPAPPPAPAQTVIPPDTPAQPALLVPPASPPINRAPPPRGRGDLPASPDKSNQR